MCHYKKWLLGETTVRYAVNKIFKLLMQNSIFILGKGLFQKASFFNLVIQDVCNLGLTVAVFDIFVSGN